MTTTEQEHVITGDHELITRAQGGDRAAFGALYQQYARVVHGILLTRLQPADADDLTQDVFLTAMKKLTSLRQPEAFAGWICAMTRHLALDWLRSRRPTSELRDTSAVQPMRSDTREAFEAIQSLPEAYRETMMLRFVEGMTGPEIAEQTGLTPESVRVNLCRGMKLLREKLR